MVGKSLMQKGEFYIKTGSGQKRQVELMQCKLEMQ